MGVKRSPKPDSGPRSRAIQKSAQAKKNHRSGPGRRLRFFSSAFPQPVSVPGCRVPGCRSAPLLCPQLPSTLPLFSLKKTGPASARARFSPHYHSRLTDRSLFFLRLGYHNTGNHCSNHHNGSNDPDDRAGRKTSVRRAVVLSGISRICGRLI